MTFWLRRFRDLEVTKKDQRKMPIEPFIDAIFLYDDKRIITYNDKEGTHTLASAVRL